MDALIYSSARANLASTMDKVFDDHSPVIVTRKSGKNVVMMSIEDFESMVETAYLLRSPANAKRLMRSIEQAERGLVKERELPCE